MLYIKKRSSLLQALFLFLALGTLASCDKDEPFDPVKQQETDDKLIRDYLSSNNVDMSTVTQTNSGLYYQVVTPGSGPTVESGDEVVVHYNGMLLNGTKFDSSYDREEPYELMVGRDPVIAGWTEGLKLMKEGEKGRLYIPSRLAYGPNPQYGSPIPANAVLVFDMELLDIK